jgi:hypothetical protein
MEGEWAVTAVAVKADSRSAVDSFQRYISERPRSTVECGYGGPVPPALSTGTRPQMHVLVRTPEQHNAAELRNRLRRTSPQGVTEGSLFVSGNYWDAPVLG